MNSSITERSEYEAVLSNNLFEFATVSDELNACFAELLKIACFVFPLRLEVKAVLPGYAPVGAP